MYVGRPEVAQFRSEKKMSETIMTVELVLFLCFFFLCAGLSPSPYLVQGFRSSEPTEKQSKETTSTISKRQKRGRKAPNTDAMEPPNTTLEKVEKRLTLTQRDHPAPGHRA